VSKEECNLFGTYDAEDKECINCKKDEPALFERCRLKMSIEHPDMLENLENEDKSNYHCDKYGKSDEEDFFEEEEELTAVEVLERVLDIAEEFINKLREEFNIEY
jgi:hypothetical protein